MKLGSQEHKELLCRSFIDSHLNYEPETLAWPELDSVALERLRGIPFWREALITERQAGAMVDAFAETVSDPMFREAIALQAAEESRHARLIQFLIDYYNIPIAEPPAIKVPSNIEMAFIDFGFGECLDSFFAFGMFDIAHQVQYLPESFFTIFDPILDEEARHIVFFVNWFTYLQIQQGQGWGAFRAVRSLWHYTRALHNLVDAFGGSANQEGTGFTASGASQFMEGLTAEHFFSTCLSENRKRMAAFDRQLLQPRLLPVLSYVALRCLKLWPRRRPKPPTQTSLG